MRDITGSPMDKEVELLMADAFKNLVATESLARRRQRVAKTDTRPKDLEAWLEDVRQRVLAALAENAKRRDWRERFHEPYTQSLLERAERSTRTRPDATPDPREK
jgi:hypothetical protein